MSHEDANLRGTAAPLRWNAGAWFGAQVGATCWMVIAAMLLLGSSVVLALALLALFVVVHGLGLALWNRRERGLSAVTGYRALLVSIGLATLAGLVAIERSGHWSKIEVGGSLPPAVAMAFVVGATGLLLVLITRRTGNTSGSD